MPTETMRAPDGTELALSTHPGREDAPLVLVLHGLLSHQGWYRELAVSLAERGINACLVDRRGAGRSGGIRGHVDSWRTLVADVACVLERLKKRHPGCATGLVGISLGGAVSLATGIMHPGLVDRQVIFCPGLASRIRLPVMRRVRLLRRARTQPTKLYPLPFGVEKLTDRAEWRAILNADPLRTREVTARFLVEFFRLQRFVSANIRSLSSPVYCMLGAEDKVIDNNAVSRILRRAVRAGCKTETFEGAQHVLHASVPAEELVERICKWVEGTATASPGQPIKTDTQAFFLPGDELPRPPALS